MNNAASLALAQLANLRASVSYDEKGLANACAALVGVVLADRADATASTEDAFAYRATAAILDRSLRPAFEAQHGPVEGHKGAVADVLRLLDERTGRDRNDAEALACLAFFAYVGGRHDGAAHERARALLRDWLDVERVAPERCEGSTALWATLAVLLHFPEEGEGRGDGRPERPRHAAGGLHTPAPKASVRPVKPNASIAEGGTGVAAQSHRTIWLLLTSLCLFSAVGKPTLSGAIVPLLLAVFSSAVYTAFCRLDELYTRPAPWLAVTGILVTAVTMADATPLLGLLKAVLVALALDMGYMAGPAAVPVASAIVRAYRRYLMFRVANG